MFDVERVGRLLNSLLVAKTVYELIREGYNPTSLYRQLRILKQYGFVREVVIKGVRHYHITTLGAELLKTLRKAIVYKIASELERKNIKYKIIWGSPNEQTISPKIIIEKHVETTPTYGLVRIIEEN